MMSKLDEAIFNARETAVEEWRRDHGECFLSKLEGYGDMVRKMGRVHESAKALRKTLERFSDFLDSDDPKVMHDLLADMECKGAAVVYDATRMYASVRVTMETVRAMTGGDLLDLIQDSESCGTGKDDDDGR